MSDDERLRLTYLLLGKDEPDTERDKMILSQTVARAADEITRLRALIAGIKAALGTEEDGDALVEVAYNAHRAEHEAAAKGRRDEP